MSFMTVFDAEEWNQWNYSLSLRIKCKHDHKIRQARDFCGVGGNDSKCQCDVCHESNANMMTKQGRQRLCHDGME